MNHPQPTRPRPLTEVLHERAKIRGFLEDTFALVKTVEPGSAAPSNAIAYARWADNRTRPMLVSLGIDLAQIPAGSYAGAHVLLEWGIGLGGSFSALVDVGTGVAFNVTCVWARVSAIASPSYGNTFQIAGAISAGLAQGGASRGTPTYTVVGQLDPDAAPQPGLTVDVPAFARSVTIYRGLSETTPVTATWWNANTVAKATLGAVYLAAQTVPAPLPVPQDALQLNVAGLSSQALSFVFDLGIQ